MIACVCVYVCLCMWVYKYIVCTCGSMNSISDETFPACKRTTKPLWKIFVKMNAGDGWETLSIIRELSFSASNHEILLSIRLYTMLYRSWINVPFLPLFHPLFFLSHSFFFFFFSFSSLIRAWFELLWEPQWYKSITSLHEFNTKKYAKNLMVKNVGKLQGDKYGHAIRLKNKLLSLLAWSSYKANWY